MPLADVPQIVVDGVWLVAAAAALGSGIGAGIRWGFGALARYLDRRDRQEAAEDAARRELTQTVIGLVERNAVALDALRGAVTTQGETLIRQGEALAELMGELLDHRLDLNNLAGVAGLREALDAARAARARERAARQSPRNPT